MQTSIVCNAAADRDRLIDETSASKKKAKEGLISFKEQLGEGFASVKDLSCKLGDQAMASLIAGKD